MNRSGLLFLRKAREEEDDRKRGGGQDQSRNCIRIARNPLIRPLYQAPIKGAKFLVEIVRGLCLQCVIRSYKEGRDGESTEDQAAGGI